MIAGNDKKTPPDAPKLGASLESETLRLTLEVAPNPMIVVDGEGSIVMANRAAGAVFGYEIDELLGQSVDILVPEGMQQAHRHHREAFNKDPQARPMGGKRDLKAVTREGMEVPVEIGLSPVDTPGGPMVVCGIVDLSLRKKTEEDLAKTATILGRENQELLELVATDSLTSLGSRQAFMEQLSAQIEVSVRHARSLSVLILDIDYFKRYNDDYGHLAGDDVLSQVGKTLRGVARRSDFVARLGGEELGVILPETDREGAGILGERFRVAIEETDWPRRNITVSVGATTVSFEQAVPRPRAPDISSLLSEADRALYRAKDMGRNRVVHAAEFNSPA